MKKLLVILGIAACLQLTACGTDTETGTAESEAAPMITEEIAEQIATSYVDYMNAIVTQDAVSQFTEDMWEFAAVATWEAVLEEMGSYQEIIESDSEINETDAIITVVVEGSERNAKIEFTYDITTGNVTNPSAEAIYSDGELMSKAGLNTLLGMGMTFAILILISIIISCFSLLPKAKNAGKVSEEEARSQSMDQAIAQIIEKEEQADDSELVAVITAAIAASQGSLSPDGFRVRSIRKINTTKWKQA